MFVAESVVFSTELYFKKNIFKNNIAVLVTKVEHLSCRAELHVLLAPKKVNEMQHDPENNSSFKD